MVKILLPKWFVLTDTTNESKIIYNYEYSFLFGLFKFSEIVQEIISYDNSSKYYKIIYVGIFNRSFQYELICTKEEAENHFVSKKVIDKYFFIFKYMDMRDYIINKLKKK